MADVDISNRLVLVAGMHRSGTSALTRILNLLGAHIPEPVVPAFSGNEHGHWEPEAVVHMNDRFLEEAGVHVNTSVPVDPDWFASPAATRAADEIARYLRPWLDNHVRVVVKDPRIALLAPVWRRAVEGMGVTPRFVLPFRRPQEVAASLARRQLRFFPDEVWPLQRGVLIWLAHVVELERATRGALRSFIGFDELLLSWRPGIERVLRQIDLPLVVPESAVAEISASLRADSRREFARDEDDVPPLVARVLAALHTCTVEPTASPPVFDAAAADLAALRLLLGDYLRDLEGKAESWGDLSKEAQRAASARDLARGEVRRLELRSTAVERANGVRAAERTRLATLSSEEALSGRLDELTQAHALAAAHYEVERLGRREAALMAARRARTDDARRTRARQEARLRLEASLRSEAEGALARARMQVAALQTGADAQAEAVGELTVALTDTRAQLTDLQREAEALVAEVARQHATLQAPAARSDADLSTLAKAQQGLTDMAAADVDQRSRISRLESDLERARVYAASLAQEKVAGVADMERERRDAWDGRERAEAEVGRLAEELRREASARAAAEARATAQAAEAASLRRTLSWRVTAPMRSVRARLR